MSLLYDALKRLEAGGASTTGVRRAAPAGMARQRRGFAWPGRIPLAAAIVLVSAVAVVWAIWPPFAIVSGNRAGASPDSPLVENEQGEPAANFVGSAAHTPVAARVGVGHQAPAGNSPTILAPRGNVPEPNLPVANDTAPGDTVPGKSAPAAVQRLAKSMAPVSETRSVTIHPHPASKVLALQGGELRRDSNSPQIVHTHAAADRRAVPRMKEMAADSGRIAVSVVKPPLRSGPGNGKPRSSASQTPQSIPLLVGQLNQAMAQGEDARVAVMLEKLDQRAGGKSLIALRMHAYWALQQGNYPSARGYYGQVLAQRPDDLQAGGNMALLEWRSGAAAAARKRLRDLRQLYPDSKTLRRYLSTMEASL